MSHQEKQEIFDQYARTREFENWNDLKNCCIEFDIDLDEYIFEACDFVQEEQQKRIAENATINYSSEDQYFFIDEYSIINPENKIQ
ncbi:hypothetical protein [Chryseobacterium sp. JV274]|uniref:hypothetical protein n=1 Tax=Chryseobacterium sp. JV274 TaxID=1932669 RepID=UPI0015C291DA|nr:hypothetical protein [Chryseobacterium sp. JV274]CAD0220374.1 conserved protein of unknown function [Chryseobacterium sp. JV274]